MKYYIIKYRMIITMAMVLIAFCMMFVGVRYTYNDNDFGVFQGKISEDWMFFGDKDNIKKYDETQMSNITVVVDWNDFDITLVKMKSIYIPVYLLLLIPFGMALYALLRKKKFSPYWLLIGFLPLLLDIILDVSSYIIYKDRVPAPSVGSIMCSVICLVAMGLNFLFDYWEKQGVQRPPVRAKKEKPKTDKQRIDELEKRLQELEGSKQD